MSKAFSRFVTTHKVATDYFHWIQVGHLSKEVRTCFHFTDNALQDMYISDESYYSTLGKIVNVEKLEQNAATVHQNLTKDTLYGQCTRTSLWHYEDCKGELINEICNVALEDLPKLKEEGCIVGNKFRLSVDAAAVAFQMADILKESGASLDHVCT